MIAATGYETGLHDLVGHLGIVRDDGEPAVHNPTDTDDLYFAGFHFGLAALLPYISRDARATMSRVTVFRPPVS